MTLDEIRQKFDEARVIRVPRINPGTHQREKIQALEDYLTLTAWHRGELEDALWWLWTAENALLEEWDQIEGYQQFLPTTAKERTQHAVRQAKRRVKPDLYVSLQLCGKLKEGIGRQIRRLELDDRNVSRTYSLATGS
jgi:hypothetical protein